MPSSAPATLWPTFVLLFAMTPDTAAGRHGTPSGIQAIPPDVAAAYRNGIEGQQQRLLGELYLQARRLSRRSIGRLALSGGASEPPFADIHLVEHKSGAAVWEVWLAAPPQAFDPVRWTGWLDMESAGSIALQVWERLAPTHAGPAKAPELMLPLVVLRYRDGDLDELVERHADDLVKLLHRDTSPERFKARFVQDELAGDFCRRARGLSLLARNAAIDVHAQPEASANTESDNVPLPRNTLPLLVTLELLCLERAVLRSFLNRFARGVYGTIDDLVQLRRDIFDGLEEYYGTLAKTHGYTAEATARGEVLFGIDDLFDSVVERIEAVTFEITTRSQRTVSQLGFWLTTSFGAIETGFVAASIATWYYADNLGAVLGWTIGVTLVTALAIAALLRSRLKA